MRQIIRAIRSYGFIDGPLIWAARKAQKYISHQSAWPFWTLSNHYENWRFRRMYNQAKKKVKKHG